MIKKIIATFLTIMIVVQGGVYAFSVQTDETASGQKNCGTIHNESASYTENTTPASAQTTVKTVKSSGKNIAKTESPLKIDYIAKKNEIKLKKKLAKEKKELMYKKGLAAYIRKVNKKVSKKKSLTLAATFIRIADKHKLDPKVLMSLAVRESRFDTNCYHSGYKGIMQTNDALAIHYGYKPEELYRASVSIDVSARYLKYLKKRFGTYTKAICGYAYGSGAVAAGRYNIEVGRKVMERRDEIKTFLTKNKYI